MNVAIVVAVVVAVLSVLAVGAMSACRWRIVVVRPERYLVARGIFVLMAVLAVWAVCRFGCP